MTNTKTQATASDSSAGAEMQKLLEQHENEVALPEIGDVVEGVVISAANSEVHIDLSGIATGMVRGPELVDESGVFTDLRPGDKVSATVLEKENEKGIIELSFREAGHRKAWEELTRIYTDKEMIKSEIIDANKGGLITRVGNVTGFLPVSQLTVEHYPRVEGANKQKILEKLKTYIGEKFEVRIIDLDEPENKLIVSEKAAREDEQSEMLSAYKVGDVVEGVVTGVVDFGAFVEFGEGLEGLVHISELAWQRIDDPKDVIAVGKKVKAQIITVENGKISLSIRRLEKDPWQGVAEKYTAGDVIEGEVLKLNPFGAFIELDKDIHGLAHISELSWKKIQSPEDVVTVGKTYKFKIVSIEPKNHRLGLSLKQMTERPASKKDNKTDDDAFAQKKVEFDKPEDAKDNDKSAETSAAALAETPAEEKPTATPTEASAETSASEKEEVVTDIKEAEVEKKEATEETKK